MMISHYVKKLVYLMISNCTVLSTAVSLVAWLCKFDIPAQLKFNCSCWIESNDIIKVKWLQNSKKYVWYKSVQFINEA